MNIEKLASEIVDLFCPACVTTSGGVSDDQVRSLLDAKLKERGEHILTVKAMIADALTPDDQ